MKTFKALIFLQIIQRAILEKPGCLISSSSMGDYEPLILSTSFNLLYPNEGKNIHVRKNFTLVISCGTPNNFENFESSESWLHIKCISGQNFFLSNRKISFADLTCKRKLRHESRPTGRCCLRNNTEVEVGFKIGKKFIRTYNSCFDRKLQTTLYSHHFISKSIGNAESTKRQRWFSDRFYHLNGMKIDDVYKKNWQIRHIYPLFHSSEYSTHIGKGELYLTRGHLAAFADFYYRHQKQCSMRLINAAPQWQAFNNGNWKLLEESVRNLAITRKINLEIYTGTYGISTYRRTKLFLYNRTRETGSVPVPKFYWKIIIDPHSKKGVGFVGLNNPFIDKENLDEFEICDGVTNSIKWLKITNNFKKGYVYACEVPDLKRKFNTIPNIRVTSLLK